MITITLNGETKQIPEAVNLSGLLEHLGLPTQRVAVELNRRVVSRSEWESTTVNDSDTLEVVHFVGGG